MYFVYILRSKKTGRYYIGQTNNLDRRLSFHNAGRERYTRRGVPWEVVFAKEFASRSAARNCEPFIKNQNSTTFIEKLISGQNHGLRRKEDALLNTNAANSFQNNYE